MKISSSIVVAVLALALNFVPRSAAAQPQDAKSAALLEIAETYLNRLCEQDFKTLATLLDQNALFEDPTRVTFTGKVERVKGRTAILEHFAKNAKGQANSDVEIVETFVSGEHVVMRLNYRSKGAANVVRMQSGPEEVSLLIPAVTILRIQHERVVHHLDHVDYASILRQVSGEEK